MIFVSTKIKIIISFYLLFLFLNFSLCSAEKKSLEDLQEEIKAAVQQELEKDLTPEWYAKELGLQYPIAEPTRTPQEIKEELQKKIATEVDKKIPLITYQELKKEAEKKYRLYKNGDTVILDTKNKARPKVRGIIQRFDSERVIIDSTWVRLKDLYPKDQDSFDPLKTKQLQNQYIFQQKTKNTDLREKYTNLLLRRLLPPKMKQEGYVRKTKEDNEEFYDNKEKTPTDKNQQEWQTTAKNFQTKFLQKKLELEQEKIKKYQKERLPKNGFIFDRNTKTWRKASFFEKLRQRF
ncbi:MAG: hypothetical protein WCS73_00345 [Lentisphaeria bacterium]